MVRNIMTEPANLDLKLDAIHEQMKALTRAVNDTRKERQDDLKLIVDAVGVISRFDDRLRELSTKIGRLDVRLGEETSDLKSIIKMEVGGQIANLAIQIENDLHEINARLSRIENAPGSTLSLA